MNGERTNQLRVTLASLPLTSPDMRIFDELCPHLTKSQIEEALRDTCNYTYFAVPDPDDTNAVIIIAWWPGREDRRNEEEEDNDDEGYDPPVISVQDKMDTTKAESYFDDVLEMSAIFVKEAIDWQLSRQTNNCE